MIKINKACLLATVGLMLAPAAAMAGNHPHDVVKDVRGNVVLNTFGNCVISKWESNTDECSGKVSASKISKEQRTVYFDFNKSTLNAKEKTKLDSLAKIITASKEVESVDIVGYADQIGKSSYNKRLSQKRAETVKSFLSSKGLKTRKVRVEGKGATGSVTKCDPKSEKNALIACLAADRRVEIELNLTK